MTTKPAIDTHVTLTCEDSSVVEKLKARAAEKKERKLVMPPLMLVL